MRWRRSPSVGSARRVSGLADAPARPGIEKGGASATSTASSSLRGTAVLRIPAESDGVRVSVGCIYLGKTIFGPHVSSVAVVATDRGFQMRRLVALAAAFIALVVAAPAQAATVNVKITKAGFSPSSVRINFGDTVKWTNSDSVNHQIVADNGSFASPIMKPKATYSFTFKTAGRFPYHDAIRPS